MMTSSKTAFGSMVVVPLLGAWLGANTTGCSAILGIADVTPAADAQAMTDDAPGADDATDTRVEQAMDASTEMTMDASVDDATAALAETVRDASTETVKDASAEVMTDALADGEASRCPQDLSYIRNAGFNIAFTLLTSQPDNVIALVNQRPVCTVGIFWDVRLVSGQIYVEIGDIDRGLVVFTSSGKPLNDGAPHDIVVNRKNGLAQILIDGVASGSSMSYQSFDGALPPLQVGTDVCLGVNGTTMLSGTITNLCIGPQ